MIKFNLNQQNMQDQSVQGFCMNSLLVSKLSASKESYSFLQTCKWTSHTFKRDRAVISHTYYGSQYTFVSVNR